MAASVGFMLSSSAIKGNAGAMIVDTMMRLKPVAERTLVTAHLRRSGHCLGLWGSCGSAKVTTSEDVWSSTFVSRVTAARETISLPFLSGHASVRARSWPAFVAITGRGRLVRSETRKQIRDEGEDGGGWVYFHTNSVWAESSRRWCWKPSGREGERASGREGERARGRERDGGIRQSAS